MTPPALSPSDTWRATRIFQHTDRPARALRAILNERGHGATEELCQALGVSRSTIKNWLPGGETGITPDRARRVATVYAASQDHTVSSLDYLGTLTSWEEEWTDQLFDRLYNEDERAAITWLLQHKACDFRAAPHSGRAAAA